MTVPEVLSDTARPLRAAQFAAVMAETLLSVPAAEAPEPPLAAFGLRMALSTWATATPAAVTVQTTVDDVGLKRGLLCRGQAIPCKRSRRATTGQAQARSKERSFSYQSSYFRGVFRLTGGNGLR